MSEKSNPDTTPALQHRRTVIDHVRHQEREQTGGVLSRCLVCHHGAALIVRDQSEDPTATQVQLSCRLRLASGGSAACTGDGPAVVVCSFFEDAWATAGDLAEAQAVEDGGGPEATGEPEPEA